MLLLSLIINPIMGLITLFLQNDQKVSPLNIKLVALTLSTLNFLSSYTLFMMFDFSTNQFQFVQESTNYFEIDIGLDGLSIYFVLLTTLIVPISLLSNWKSIDSKVTSYVTAILLLELLLLIIFMILDVLSFYVFFESILPPAIWFGKSLLRDKLSNYGDHLKFLIPSYNWKIICGPNNYWGTVTSQKMSENEVENRVSKAVVGKTSAVKEQRVDGSCINKFMLRGTLKGFEKNYQIRILSNQINKKMFYSTSSACEAKPFETKRSFSDLIHKEHEISLNVVLWGTNLSSTVGERFTRSELSIIKLPIHIQNIMVGLIL